MSARDLKILSEQTRLIYTDNHVTIARELLSYLGFHKFFLEYFTICNITRYIRISYSTVSTKYNLESEHISIQ